MCLRSFSASLDPRVPSHIIGPDTGICLLASAVAQPAGTFDTAHVRRSSRPDLLQAKQAAGARLAVWLCDSHAKASMFSVLPGNDHIKLAQT